MTTRTTRTQITADLQRRSPQISGNRRSNLRKSASYRIAVIPGDGTGPEVIREGRKVLEAAASQGHFRLEWREYDLGGARYLKTKETLPSSVLKELREAGAIYLGAIGHPDVKPGILEQGILLRLRFELDQYINLRPVKLYPGVWTPLRDKQPEDIDFVVVRENTEGLYAGVGGFLRKGTADEVALQTSVNTRKGVERCIRFAFETTRKRSRKKLTLCGKTNVLTFAHDLWQRVFEDVAKEYKDIQTDYTHVDACCMWMVKNPEWFDVIVTDNMFGDIITDLGAMIQGGMGIAAGGNLNPQGVSMFEPIGGSAPKYTGKHVINPLAAICAGSMMLEHLGQMKAAAAIERAVINITATKLKSLAAGKMGYSTSEVGDLVVKGLLV
ncbi:MAG: 3-isopropylmalate dehydrogenase [Candidatus Omnitrophica bacterium]|nr:3-isopropylmalate dehydrogenase [Candidatus Omnitrophota bacterium]